MPNSHGQETWEDRLLERFGRLHGDGLATTFGSSEYEIRQASARNVRSGKGYYDKNGEFVEIVVTGEQTR